MSKCEHLQQWAQDSRIPVSYHKETDSYSFDLPKKAYISNMHCIFCGGFGFPECEVDPSPCHCDWLSKSAKSHKIPIQYDPKLNEYRLLLQRQNMDIMIYYCPCCGGRTPESSRDKLFTTPSPEDMDQVMGRLKNVEMIEQVRNILGEPDEYYEPDFPPEEEQRIYHMKPIKQTLVYNHISQSFRLDIQEYDNGEIGYSFSGHHLKE